MNKEPLLPKRLAAKIRAAQSKVISARYDVINYEERIAENRKRLAEFDSNPEAFANKWYPGHAVDSYPVQTNIERCREDYEYRTMRMPSKLDELREADLNLEKVTNAVLRELGEMRPFTPGRVPFPDPLEPFEAFKAAENESNRVAELESERRAAEDDAAFEAEMAALEREYAMEEEQFYAEWRQELSLLSPAERAQKLSVLKRIHDAVRDNEVTVEDVIAMTFGKDDVR